MNSDGAITFSIKSSFDTSAVRGQLADAIRVAQKKLDARILADCNYYVPLKTGTLQKSAIIYTRIGSGRIVWKTPYARAQYYGEHYDHSQQRNPNACPKWFEAAKARKNEQWRKLVDDTIKSS